MTVTDFNARCVRRDQCERDTDILLLSNQVVRVIEMKRQAKEGGHRSERNIAFFPVQADTQHIGLARMCLTTDDTGIRHGGCVTAGFRAGQGKTRDILATGKAWQVMIFLFLGAIGKQQFCRSQ